MRIFYDHQLFSLQSAGGASRYFYELMRYLVTVPEVRMHLLLGLSADGRRFQELPPGKLRVTKFSAPIPPRMELYVANELLSNGIAPFIGKMDVYHSTLYRRVPLVRARRLAATQHDCTNERFPSMVRHSKEVMRAKRQLYAQADAIICVSESCRQDLLAFYPVDAAKTRVIHHGLSHLPRCESAARELQARLRRPYLLYVGSRAGYKNFQGFLEAFRESGLHSAYDLLVLGGGSLTPQESANASRLELAGRIVSIPAASDELLAEAYAAAALFVYPSLWEGFGFPPLEAMDAGCAVVASHTSSLPEVCGDAPFYFDPAEQASLVAALLRAINDDSGRKQAIVRGRAVAARYRWEECGKKTLELYREC